MTKKSAIVLFLIIVGLSIIPHQSMSYEMVMIQAVSQKKKTFVIRRGKKNKFYPDQEATFSSPLFSFIARVTEISNEYSQWLVLEPDGKIPFKKGQVVIIDFADHNIWAKNPRKILEKFGKRRNEFNHALSLRGFYYLGMFESISQTDSPEIYTRQGNHYQGLYQYQALLNLYLGIGGRFETEFLDSQTITVESTRNYVIGDISYYFSPFGSKSDTDIYFGLGIGYGKSSTKVAQATHTGTAVILPSVRAGIEIFYNSQIAVHLEVGVESISIQENFENGQGLQDTNVVNSNIGGGIKYYF